MSPYYGVVGKWSNLTMMWAHLPFLEQHIHPPGISHSALVHLPRYLNEQVRQIEWLVQAESSANIMVRLKSRIGAAVLLMYAWVNISWDPSREHLYIDGIWVWTQREHCLYSLSPNANWKLIIGVYTGIPWHIDSPVCQKHTRGSSQPQFFYSTHSKTASEPLVDRSILFCKRYLECPLSYHELCISMYECVRDEVNRFQLLSYGSQQLRLQRNKLTRVTRKQTLRSLSLSYQMKDGRAWPRPSFFWHDTDFSRI